MADALADDEGKKKAIDADRRPETADARQMDCLNADDHRVALRLYEGAAALHFPQARSTNRREPRTRGGRDFAAFALDCLHSLDRDSPRRIVDEAVDE